MKEIKFTTKYEQTLSFEDKDFRVKYEERVGDNENYREVVDGETKHLAVCPLCDNPVVILGVYKQINEAPHARHRKNISIPGVAEYNEFKYLRCPYHKKRANYVKEYVPETEEPQRRELYRIAKEHFDKAIHLLQKYTGIHISNEMARQLAENYVVERAYNYIDATIYNVPWYMIYCHLGFPLYHMIVKKGSALHKQLKKLGIRLKESRIDNHVYIDNNNGYILRATEYRYAVDKNDNLNEKLMFSILLPDENEDEVLLYRSVDRFLVDVDSYHFGNLVGYPKWKPIQALLDIANEYMNP